ncbi:porin family protein [Hymenobacter pini]|uniref:porin family protein n=1 Tax=Hymenobacter pini TaxID=2880879 RepID=UPI001CF18B1E|nr:porin family protein [Hymenobacter pini]MCA8830174.1 PorT family protein [Hymenobacter pini]
MKYLLGLSATVLLAGNAQGQVNLNVGPRIGLNVATARYEASDRIFNTTSLIAGEAGAMATISRNHVALQVSALYAQKGFRFDQEFRDPSTYQRSKQMYRLNYLTIPVSVAYSQRPNGQGFQVFTGGYAAMLLNGQHTFDDYTDVYGNIHTVKGDLDVRIDDVVELKEGGIASKRFDAGVQAGIGYGYNHWLLQIGYSYGLRDVGAEYRQSDNTSLYAIHFENRVAQLSVAYLFGVNRKE